MKNFSKEEIINRINKLVDEEFKNCNDYCKLNPEDAKNRKRDSQIFYSALIQLEYSLEIRK